MRGQGETRSDLKLGRKLEQCNMEIIKAGAALVPSAEGSPDGADDLLGRALRVLGQPKHD
jgi:hypothetical protein